MPFLCNECTHTLLEVPAHAFALNAALNTDGHVVGVLDMGNKQVVVLWKNGRMSVLDKAVPLPGCSAHLMTVPAKPLPSMDEGKSWDVQIPRMKLYMRPFGETALCMI